MLAVAGPTGTRVVESGVRASVPAGGGEMDFFRRTCRVSLTLARLLVAVANQRIHDTQISTFSRARCITRDRRRRL